MNIKSGDNLLPLTPQLAGILLALAEKQMYGYAILHQVRIDSGLVISTGSLYPALRYLEVAMLIEDAGTEKAISSPYKRKLYRLTNLGRDLLGAEMNRQADFVALARHRLKHG